MRILLSAYACEPGKGSEPGVGWHLSRALAQLHDVWVITRANNQGAIEAWESEHGASGVHWVYYDLPPGLRWWKRGGRGVQLYYYLWQRGIRRVARGLARTVAFDVVQHVTFVKYWTPCFVADVAPRFVWGPVGGGEETPRAFYARYSLRCRSYEALRSMSRWLAEKDPALRRTARTASCAVVTTEQTGGRVRALGATRVIRQWESGLSEHDMAMLAGAPRADPPLRFLSSGRLLHLKGFDLGIEAFSRARLDSAGYWIVGDGPERRRLQELASRCGVAERVRFFGQVPRSEALEILKQADVLVHPSLHDSGGWVCIEAMAASKPVICLDTGGPATQVTDECGYVVSAESVEAALAGISNAMEELADPEVLTWKAGLSRERASEFLWSTRARFYDRLYASLNGSDDS